MIEGFDSAYPPNDAQLAAAYTAGVRFWAGYLGTRDGLGLLNRWSEQDFERVKAAGMGTMGYCSGWDDPAGCKALGEQFGIPISLDVEDGIRGDGPWVQGWLNDSGAGLYGNPPVFVGKTFPTAIMAAYPNSGDPDGATWQDPPYPTPPVPHGWQWAGTHDFAGISVDSSWLDDWFAASAPQEDEMKWFTVLAPDGVAQWVVMPSGFKFPLFSQEDLAVIRASGNLVETINAGPVSQAQLDAWPTLGAGQVPSIPGGPVPPHDHPLAFSVTATTGQPS